MTPDEPPYDRTVIRPPGDDPVTEAPPAADGGVQRTQRVLPTEMVDIPVAPPPPPAAPAEDVGNGLPLGTRLGEFELKRQLGEGGFGIVYLAYDHSLEREVALKEYMPSSLAARVGGHMVQVKSERYRETFQAGLESFVKEARMLASFDHPSLIKVYRFWESNGTAYMVMPLLRGTNLKDLLGEMRRGGRQPDEAWLRSVLGQLTEALLVIHAEKVYHRDIAPDNVMHLPEKDRWLLLDFGAARRVIGDMTQALTVILKPGYAPVEQYAEIPGMKQGPWTDVYALAAVVHYAIMGKTPPPSVGRLLNDTYVPLVQAAEGRCSERFLAAIDRALAVRPEHRTQSIGELRSDLGLGEVQFDPYTTRPLAGAAGADTAPAPLLQPTVALGGVLPTAMFPAPAPASGAPAAPARAAAAGTPAARPAVAAAPAEAGRGKGLMIGIGLVALAAVAVGGYAVLAPSPKPAAPEQAAGAPPATTAITTPAAGPSAAPPAAAPAPAPPPPPSTFEPGQEFARVVKAQTAGFDVRVVTNQQSYRIGKDKFSFTVQAEREGYVYVFVYGADKALVRLYPSVTAGPLKVRPGQVLKLPPPPDSFDTTGPAGSTDLLVMVSARQRDHASLKPRREGPVLILPTGAEAAALAATHAGPGPAMAGSPVCPTSDPCADEYGAAQVRVDVVP